MTPVSAVDLISRAIQASATGSHARPESAIPARVVGMLDQSTVRLTLLGVMLDVKTPVPFLAGARVTVTLEQSDGALRLHVKPKDAARVMAPGPPIGLEDHQRPDQLRTLASNISRAFVIEGAAASTSASDRAAHSNGEGTGPTPVIHPHHRGQTAGAPSVHGAVDAATVPFRQGAAGQMAQSQLPLVDTAAARPVAGVLEQALGTGFERTTTALGTYSFVPLETHRAIDLHVDREEERRARSSDSAESAMSWSVRFLVDSPEFGPVHAFIRQRSAGIGVRLVAERLATAQTLQEELPLLGGALRDAALDVEALSVMTGRPDFELGL